MDKYQFEVYEIHKKRDIWSLNDMKPCSKVNITEVGMDFC